jgi:hypothetical protein
MSIPSNFEACERKMEKLDTKNHIEQNKTIIIIHTCWLHIKIISFS